MQLVFRYMFIFYSDWNLCGKEDNFALNYLII